MNQSFDTILKSGTVINQTSTTGTVMDSHSYTIDGVFTITLTVTDSKGGGAGTSIFQYAVIYNPNAGFVTGGGWISSPAGAYVANPALAGKATFGFEAKYQQGANVPTGNTQFHFDVGNLDFHSTSYDWLVISGAKAQYKGSGQINNAGSDGFLLTAIDGGLPGGGGQDRFRIKIWDKNTGTILYDNQLGADDTADPTTVIGAGKIIIHSSNQLLNEAPLEGNDHGPLSQQQLQPDDARGNERRVHVKTEDVVVRKNILVVVERPAAAEDGERCHVDRGRWPEGVDQDHQIRQEEDCAAEGDRSPGRRAPERHAHAVCFLRLK